MTTVVNKYKVNMSDPDIVYIGRGSPFGNPFKMLDKSDAERDRVVKEYKLYLWKMIKSDPIIKDKLLELNGKRLAYYCAPKACHGDVLVSAIEWVKIIS
ncbi:DUF4326 domain-containing protein [Pseudomonas sp.]|uniref:DUF4326 domain-containing protein n=1 Tax=Pseudomonas sp. TaxID=306 RepID=UPI003FD792D5